MYNCLFNLKYTRKLRSPTLLLSYNMIYFVINMYPQKMMQLDYPAWRKETAKDEEEGETKAKRSRKGSKGNLSPIFAVVYS